MPSPHPLITDDTVLAALQAHVGESLPKLSDYAPNQVSHMRYAVDAAARHLVDTGAITRTPLIPDPDATGKPCGIHPAARADAFCACGHIVAVHTRRPDRSLTCDLCEPATGPVVESAAAVRQCRICGCTDEEACPGGCSWSQPQICSTCAHRQRVLDEQYLDTLNAQQRAAEQQAEQAGAVADLVGRIRALADEQTEVARMEREHLAGATWRQAVACAAAAAVGAGSPTQDDGVHERIEADAEWFAHLLGTPPVTF